MSEISLRDATPCVRAEYKFLHFSRQVGLKETYYVALSPFSGDQIFSYLTSRAGLKLPSVVYRRASAHSWQPVGTAALKSVRAHSTQTNCSLGRPDVPPSFCYTGRRDYNLCSASATKDLFCGCGGVDVDDTSLYGREGGD